MKQYIKHNPWKIIEEGLLPEYNKVSESIFSLGNGKIGQRGNFEEYYSGETLRGNYISGVYYPDKTRVGWWKNGYPEYFAKVLNAPDWTGIKISINEKKLDLHTCKITDFKRVLNMKKGYFRKRYTAEFPDGKKIKIKSKRFLSIVNDELGVIKYSVEPVNFEGKIEVLSDINADIINQDSNYDEKFWVEIEKSTTVKPYVISETKKTFFRICTAMDVIAEFDGKEIPLSNLKKVEKEKYVGIKFTLPVKKGKTTRLFKFASITSSMNYDKNNLAKEAYDVLEYANDKGYEALLYEQEEAWKKKWEESDIVIKGDISAQQGIRFNIFQLNQTYTGQDERLNIGPKGFTGEKYGGSTYWDTEAYLLPFYLSTADEKVAKQLLKYRYNHLDKAIENGEKLGFNTGAALYPMVTMNGEECHNEWEITFEEIHRNGAIAFAIFDYVNYTGNKTYIAKYGLEVLIGISKFWAQRINFSEEKQKYVMLGVTGPNEYENNVNNNWYTNTIACKTMKYTAKSIEYVKQNHPKEFKKIIQKTKFNADTELANWEKIYNNMYFPYDEKRKVFLQQDGFLDKELKPVSTLSHLERPIHQHWSWDRILRSCYIKQADVLQGLYFFEDDYDIETIRRNFDFYEPLTVHESSLSSCVHSILAAKIGDKEKAYNFYLNAARLDLDDYNNDTEDGLHVTSMGGTWMTIVKGFGGMRIKDNKLSFAPFIPEQWQSYSFKIRFRGTLLNIEVSKKGIQIENESNKNVEIILFDEIQEIKKKNVFETK
ncbi:MAG: glycoside hydrolase family 65 protein [Bacteroidales bacterium]|nr:glycoside hydrolase family 65 protein [Bacteroidales bacterium]